jgi:hypothetical protein
MHLRLAAFHPFLYISHALSLLDAPTGYWIECWGAKSLAGAYAEARMMPGAAHRTSYKKTAAKWGAIMRTEGPNREHFIAATDKEHCFTADVAEQHSSVRNG